MELTHIAPNLAVAGQIQPSQLREVGAAGFKGIINNRPDGEAPEQPRSDEIEAEARRVGLAYWHIPIVPGEAGKNEARAFAAALEKAQGPVLAFCRTGNRSTALWTMAQRLG